MIPTEGPLPFSGLRVGLTTGCLPLPPPLLAPPPPGERAAFFLGPVPEDKLPKDATPGRVLAGSLTLGTLGYKGNDTPCPASVQVSRRWDPAPPSAAALPGVQPAAGRQKGGQRPVQRSRLWPSP